MESHPFYCLLKDKLNRSSCDSVQDFSETYSSPSGSDSSENFGKKTKRRLFDAEPFNSIPIRHNFEPYQDFNSPQQNPITRTTSYKSCKVDSKADNNQAVTTIEELTRKMEEIFESNSDKLTSSYHRSNVFPDEPLKNRFQQGSFMASKVNQANKYKTRMCRSFLATGTCRYGVLCTFAHCKSEKRKDISTIYKFKTNICRLWLSGKCAFGSACHFAHGFSDIVSNTL